MSKDYVRSNRSVERAMGLLLLVCQSKTPLGLTEISRDAGLDKATTLRLLTSLTNVSFLQQELETRRYTRGAGIYSLWADEVSRLARPHLETLTGVSNETACLIMPRGETARICVDAVHPDRDLRVVAAIGKTQPIYGGASGAVLLAFRPPKDAARILDSVELEALTDKTLTDKKKFLSRLSTVREQGYALLRGEVEAGTSAIAAPVLDSHGLVAASVVLRGPDVRMGDDVIEELVPHVLRANADVSAVLAMISGSTI